MQRCIAAKHLFDVFEFSRLWCVGIESALKRDPKMNLKELSRQLGLSQTTVSRALNGYPEVNETTRERVIAAANRLNYRPNMRARSLATGRAMAIGHVIPISTKHEMLNPIFADFIAGAGETYQKSGYDMVLSVVNDEEEIGVYNDLAAKRGVDGIMVHAPRQNDPRMEILRNLNLPFVVHGRATNETGDYNWLDINNRRAFVRATEFLIDLGHQDIALVNGLENMDFAVRRRRGYLEALASRGIPERSELMRSEEMTESYGYEAANALLEADTPPTAFLASSIITANGIRRAIEARGLVLGRDVSVVTHDDDLSYFRNGADTPIFTALRSSVRQAGRRAAEMLLDLIEDRRRAPMQELMEVDFILGESTGPAPSRAVSPPTGERHEIHTR
ncbi:MAG: substrate-binding domain-containing protein [Rhodobacteraceae bacterium]|nr:substrate-binding domain-containing protein [Paracoccaceae bacterium]